MFFALPPPYPGSEFPLGRLGMTFAASKAIAPLDVSKAIARHTRRDWGDVGPDDWRANDKALVEGSRLFSTYRDQKNTVFWIITEADRSATTVLLPEDY